MEPLRGGGGSDGGTLQNVTRCFGIFEGVRDGTARETGRGLCSDLPDALARLSLHSGIPAAGFASGVFDGCTTTSTPGDLHRSGER